MSSPRLALVLLCVLLPLQGLAQAQPRGDAPMAPTTPPPLVPAPEATGETPDEPRGELIPPQEGEVRGSGMRGVRVPLGILVGTLAGAIGAIPGSLLGLSALCFDSCSNEDDTMLYLGLALAFAGMTGGSALGINALGDALQGQGRFGPTLLGVVLGTLGGLAAAIVVGIAGGEAFAFIPAVLGPAAGGVIAYEISHSNVIDELTAATASRPRFVPLVSVSAQGTLIGGLAGRF